MEHAFLEVGITNPCIIISLNQTSEALAIEAYLD